MPRRKKKKYHFLYKTTNLINGKFYIGVHSTDNLNDGYLGSGKILRYSIRKYGIENFKIERLEFFEDKEKLFEREKEVVNESFLKDPLCMNLTFGGYGSWNYQNSDIETQRKKWKKALSRLEWLKENDPDWVNKKRKNMSSGQIKSYKNGRIPIIPDWTGKKHNQKSKDLIGEKNKISQKGNLNSQFGTFWITNGRENKKIKKGQIIPEGFKLGRKMGQIA